MSDSFFHLWHGIKPAAILFLAVAMSGCRGSGQLLSDTDPRPGNQFTSFTDDGAWCWFSDPRAIYHEGNHKRLYSGWVTHDGDIIVGSYDYETKLMSTTILAENLQADDHNHPSLMVTPDDHIMAFYSKHATQEPILLRKSVEPESISSWTQTDTLDLNDSLRYAAYSDTYTYTHPVYLAEEDRIYLFWRGSDFKPNMAVSDDMGSTWSKGHIFILPERKYSNRRPYLKVDSNGRDEIHFAFTQGHPRRESGNSIYYMRYHNGAYYRADGSKIKEADSGSSVQPGEADIVYNATGKSKAWVWDVAYDENDHPVIVYAKFPDDSTHVYAYARWNGNEWVNHDLVNSGKWFPETPEGETEPEPNYSGGISLDHENPDIVYLSRQKEGIFEVEQWRTTDNGETWQQQTITKNSSNDNVRPAAVKNAENDNPLQFLWMNNQKYIHYSNFRTSIKLPVPEEEQ